LRRGAWLAVGLWLLLMMVWPAIRPVAVSVAMIAATTGGVVAHGVAAARSSGRARRLWLLCAGGLACWGLVEIAIGIPSILSGQRATRPMWADVLNLAALGLAIAAMLAIPSAPRTLAGRLRLLLDGLVVASATLGAVWMLVVSALLRRTQSMMDTVVEVAYPILAIGTLTIAVLAFAGQRRWRGSALTYMAGSIATIAFALLVETFADAYGVAWMAVWVQAGLLASAVLMALTPLAPLPPESERSWDASTTLGRALPYLPVAAYTAMAATVGGSGVAPQPPAIWAGVIMISCVMGRQFLALQLNVRLAHSLEEQRAALAHEVLHDSLTGLPNRTMLHDRIRHLDERADPGVQPALLMVDLDGFKSVNDTLGHAAGDQLLVVAADRLRTAAGAADHSALAVRLGGDEFAILLPHGGRSLARQTAERLLETLAAPLSLTDRRLAVRASIGLAIGGQAQTATRELLRNADLALYEAKAHGKGCFREYDESMSAQLHRARELELEVSDAIAGDQLELVYQPIVDLRSGAVHSLEALVRWRHPQRGRLTPHAFLPAAEATGLMPALDRWVLARACEQARLWHTARPGLVVNANVSAAYLSSGALTRDVRRVLTATGLPPQSLTIEVTETAILADLEAAARTLSTLRRHGVRVALDDFGVGYSSLSHLHRLPIDIIKVDRSFVRDVADNAAGSIIDLIIALGRRLDIETVAEGVEEESQAERLRLMRCTRAQGFLFATPMPADDVAGYLGAAGSMSRAAAQPDHGPGLLPSLLSLTSPFRS
jgi:diguanylate cyclase (GGDEF)-like protein